MPLRDTLRAIATRLGVHLRRKTHQTRIEDAGVHRLEIARDARPEAHMRDDVALGIETQRDLDQLQPLVADAKHGSLGDEQRNLVALAADARAVADLLQLRHELHVPAFLADDGPALLPGDV